MEEDTSEKGKKGGMEDGETERGYLNSGPGTMLG